MKTIGRTNMGCMTVGTEADYKFVVVDDNCSRVCPGVEMELTEVIGDLEITPTKLITDIDGQGQVHIKLGDRAAGMCSFGFNFVKKEKALPPLGWDY